MAENPKILVRSYNLRFNDVVDAYAPDVLKAGLNDFVDAIEPVIAHNEIVFVNPDGQEICLNGEGWNRETAQTDITAFFKDSTLRASITSAGMKHAGLELIEEGVAWEGNVKEWEEMYLKSAEISSFINDQNLDYHPVGIVSEGQNSNSVVSTILKGLKLNYPAAIQSLNAPGSDRILLPSEPLLLQNGDMDNWNTESLHDYAEILVLGIDKEMVHDQVLQDKLLDKTPVDIFEPDNVLPLQAESVLRAKNILDTEPQQRYFQADTNIDSLEKNALIQFSYTSSPITHLETHIPSIRSENLEKLSAQSGVNWITHNSDVSGNVVLLPIKDYKDQDNAQNFFEKFEFSAIVTGEIDGHKVIGLSLDEIDNRSDDEITALSRALKQNFRDADIVEQEQTFSPNYDYNARAVIPGIM